MSAMHTHTNTDAVAPRAVNALSRGLAFSAGSA
jgi:hypothetical protein